MSTVKESKTVNSTNLTYHTHPLDQLSANEIARVATITRQAKPDIDFVFNTITLWEPKKTLMLSYLGWDTSKPRITQIEREAFVVTLEKLTMKCYEGIVSLTTGKLTSWKYIPDVQPMLTMDEMFEVEELVLKSELVRQECLELGIKDMSNVFSDPWAIARHVSYPGRQKRLMQALMYYRACEEDNQYAHPLDFIPIIDLGQMKVVSIERIKPRSSKFARPTIPLQQHNFLPEFINENDYRKDIKPLIVQQPQGVSFTVKGNEIDWQKWNMRISMNYREGLVIHNISYQDGCEKRPLFYRISLSEMVVPYAETNDPHHRKHAFDVGEYGMGLCTNSLALGCDCLGSIYYFDAVFNDHTGKPIEIPNAICLHEEDYGILMKHTDYRNGRAHTIRSRRLVVSQFVTVANYDYGLYYYFYQDGTFEYEVKATGILNTHVLAEDESPSGMGTIVAPQINAQYHQHFFTMRIDPMIDGINNSVQRVDTYSLPYPTGHPLNPFGNGFTTKYTTLKNTKEGQQVDNWETSRYFKIVNQDRIHPYSQTPVGWKITSGHTAPFYAQPDSLVAERAGFAKKTLWVTPYDEHQMFAGGFYCNQSAGDDTVEVWANRELRNIEQTDIVLWYTFGITHLPRVEDFPIMPVEYCGFIMKPFNFFMANPALDVPPPNKKSNQSLNVKDKVKPTNCCSTKL
ncbi:copper amine oxidase [Choanephora cucurbitarum]|nr:copper amine oxidase [Choanephora cucurbitarum]